MGLDTQVDKESPDEWEAYRATITELYKRHTLKEVIQVMRDKHGFFATRKTYKARFNQWGLHKNFRSKFPDKPLLRVENEDGHSSEPGAGRAKDVRRNQHARSRLVAATSRKDPEKPSTSTTSLASKSLVPKSSNRSIVSTRSPAPKPPVAFFYPMPEECIYLLRLYVSGNFDSGPWRMNRVSFVPDEKLKLPIEGWFRSMLIVEDALKYGRTKQAFQVLDACCHRYGSMLVEHSHRLIALTYVAAVRLSGKTPEVAKAVIRYVWGLSQAFYKSSSHPISVFMSRLYRMTPEELRQSSSGFLQAYFDSFHPYVDPTSSFATELNRIHAYTIYLVAQCGALETSSAEAQVLRLTKGNDWLASKAKGWVADLYLVEGKYKETRRMITETLQTPIKYLDNSTIFSSYRVLFILARKVGEREEVVREGRRLIDFCFVTFGGQDPRSVDALNWLEAYLRESGDVEAAEKLRQEADLAMNELCLRLGGSDTLPGDGLYAPELKEDYESA